jgi:hypothetical protein
VAAVETVAGIQKPAAFDTGEDAGNEGASMNPEEAWTRQCGSWLFQREKATELSNERQAMLPCGFGFRTSASDKVTDDLHRDHRIIRWELLGEEAIEDAESACLVTVAIAGGALALEEPVKGCRQR